MPLRSTSLGDLERAVMDALWSHGPDLSVRDVMDQLLAAGNKELAYTTVMTVLDRLAKKGLTDRTRDGRAWRYTAAASREELAATALRSAFDTVQADRRVAMLHFLDDASPAELDDLRAALAEVEQRHG
ncbi:BlaI/MecI/CopY family transcriptional regulator [Ornithinimicrobium pratense]|uniref:BlaI/MecI/CopY family transcriptional regulator n=1 Tax=Ornithinimicrobium pratense TaxID=2593973 RepID=A0A5J6V2U4_9MICO|nr:BlaI/MecI/CopY family transcriptional regulator [Ornithinimicrobium pratense]QFG67482.1 BlaI/MecI/CopY family transcriptional regulator [Ornithinimicrobium pratense]